MMITEIHIINTFFKGSNRWENRIHKKAILTPADWCFLATSDGCRGESARRI